MLNINQLNGLGSLVQIANFRNDALDNDPATNFFGQVSPEEQQAYLDRVAELEDQGVPTERATDIAANESYLQKSDAAIKGGLSE